jgi:hypothetical protein
MGERRSKYTTVVVWIKGLPTFKKLATLQKTKGIAQEAITFVFGCTMVC